MSSPEAIVVGGGPNGLSAAIALAEKGRHVRVLEGAETVGGGSRSAELTLPGFVHDVCSAVHPLAAASPLFRKLPLERHGLEWVHPAAALAHPLDGEAAVVVRRSLQESAADLGPDGGGYRRVVDPLLRRADHLVEDVLGNVRRPRHPTVLARFGLVGVRSAAHLAGLFGGAAARALIAGLAAHAALPLDRPGTAGTALLFAVLAHHVGWPIARGGSGRIAGALAAHLRSLDGEVVTGARVTSLADVGPGDPILLDVTPRALLSMAGRSVPAGYRWQVRRFRPGPGAFKLDWALDGPVPWAAEGCREAATVHVGGTFEEIAASEAAAWRNEVPERPFLILCQPTLFDPARAPRGKHTLWAYCHVPNGSDVDMTERIERQIERFAPGFRDRILARHAMGPADLERYNPNYEGGDVAGGAMELRQILVRPAFRPYATPLRGVFLCSSSTPPGPGVHGMCGVGAARAALARWSRRPG